MSESTTTGVERVVPAGIPFSLLMAEIAGLYGTQFLAEAKDIINYYKVYDEGADFTPDGAKGDYVPSKLRYKESRKLINREARFLFSNPPDIDIDVPFDRDNEQEKQMASAQQSIIHDYVSKVLEKTQFNSKLLKAAQFV